MSASQSFALCIDCWEFHYATPDRNGVYQRDSSSSNHHACAVHVFGIPDSYAPPIRTVLASLQAGLPISDGRLEMFSLACAVTAIQPNNGKSVKPEQDYGASGAPREHVVTGQVQMTLE